MQEVSKVQNNYCQQHRNRQLEYVYIGQNLDQKFMCQICHLKGKSAENVNHYLSINEIQENDLTQPIQNWPKDINHELMDHLYSDRSDCRQDMQVKIQTHFKQLQCSVAHSIEQQQEQTLNILNSLYNELEQQQNNYNKFFLREKLHKIFNNEQYSNEQLNELQQEVEQERIKNLEYLEKRRKLADIFEKKIFQQPIEITNTVNYLLQNIDFFESEELRSIIPNYKNLSSKELLGYNSQIAEQTLYLINQSCKLQQVVFESDQIMEWRKKQNTFQKQFDQYIQSDFQDILKELKNTNSNISNQLNQKEKNDLIQELNNQSLWLNQKQSEQLVQSQNKKIEKSNDNKEIKSIQKDLRQKQQIFFPNNLKQQNYTIKPTILHSEYLYNKFIMNNYCTPQMDGFQINEQYQEQILPDIFEYYVSSSQKAQVYLDLKLDNKLTYIILFKIPDFNSSRSLQFGLVNNSQINQQDNSIQNQQLLFQQQSQTQMNYFIDTNSNSNVKLIRGKYISERNIPEYIIMKVNIEQQYLSISDYIDNKNVVQYQGNIDINNEYKLAFGFGRHHIKQSIQIEYLEISHDFEEF